MKNTILNKIMASERFAQVQSVYSILVSKYGNVTVGGGCLVDSYYGENFYDIDCFISYKDLKDEWKQQIELNNKNHIVHVFRDEINGFDIDIVVVDYSVAKHIRRFDQCFKQIWLDRKGLHMTKQAAKDITENKITVGVLNGPAIYFRVLRSARKYNMTVDPFDMWLMENFMSCLKYLNLPSKYRSMQWEFMPHKNPDELLGRIVFKYSRIYWDLSKVYAPSWTMLKRFIAPYVMRHGLNKNK